MWQTQRCSSHLPSVCFSPLQMLFTGFFFQMYVWIKSRGAVKTCIWRVNLENWSAAPDKCEKDGLSTLLSSDVFGGKKKKKSKMSVSVWEAAFTFSAQEVFKMLAATQLSFTEGLLCNMPAGSEHYDVSTTQGNKRPGMAGIITETAVIMNMRFREINRIIFSVLRLWVQTISHTHTHRNIQRPTHFYKIPHFGSPQIWPFVKMSSREINPNTESVTRCDTVPYWFLIHHQSVPLRPITCTRSPS